MMTVNGKWERTWKETILAILGVHLARFLDFLRKITINLNEESR